MLPVGLGADRGGLDRAPFPEGDPMTRLANLCAVSAVLALSFAGSARGQAPALSDFVLFGSDTVRARGLDVTSGDVGTNGTLVGSKAIQAPDSTIVGNRVELDK